MNKNHIKNACKMCPMYCNFMIFYTMAELTQTLEMSVLFLAASSKGHWTFTDRNLFYCLVGVSLIKGSDLASLCYCWQQSELSSWSRSPIESNTLARTLITFIFLYDHNPLRLSSTPIPRRIPSKGYSTPQLQL